MTDLLDGVRPEPKRDQYGRYLLPDPDTGKEVAWTRATTWSGTMKDRFGLNKWEMRMVAKGLGLRPDLHALAASTPLGDKKALDRVVQDAKEAAEASSGANKGTALHRFTELYDLGEPFHAPAPYDRDVEAYAAKMKEKGLRALPQYIERIVVVPDLGIAGTLDRIVAYNEAGDLRILDFKSGANLFYSLGEIEIQLAIYANAGLMWNDRTGEYEPMPEVDKDLALIAHCAAGSGHCEIIESDIARGLEFIKLSGQVRAWRQRKPLQKIYDPSKTAAGRIARAKNKAELKALWEQAKTEGLVTEEVKRAVQRRLSQLQSK